MIVHFLFIISSVAICAATVVVTRAIRIGKQNGKQVECVFNFGQPKYSARVERRDVILSFDGIKSYSCMAVGLFLNV